MLRKHLIVAAALGTAALALTPSAVKADTAALTVTASVSNTCHFNAASASVGFGPYDGSADITQTYTASYQCSSGDGGYRFSFKGTYNNGVQCAMSDGAGHQLSYNISDTGGGNFGCDGTSSAHPFNAPVGNDVNPLSYPFTFKLLKNQTVPVGNYTDTNTVTITP